MANTANIQLLNDITVIPSTEIDFLTNKINDRLNRLWDGFTGFKTETGYYYEHGAMETFNYSLKFKLTGTKDNYNITLTSIDIEHGSFDQFDDSKRFEKHYYYSL